MDIIWNWLATALTAPIIFNLIITGLLVFITYKYTRATQVIANLEEERKMWDVKPIVVPFKKFFHEGFNQYYVYGIKNVGRGVARIDSLKTKSLPESQEYENNKQHYELIFPTHLGIMEEVVYTRTIGNEVEFKNQSIQIEYSDIHDNLYYTSLLDGKIDTGKLPKS